MKACAGLALLALLAGSAAAALDPPCNYIVKGGESLSIIGNAYNLTLAEVLAANEARYPDPTLIQPGDIISLPCKEKSEADTVWDLLAYRPDLSVLYQAVIAAGWVNITNDTALLATVFAPNNTAFEELLVSLNVTAGDLFQDKPLLLDVLGYHIVNGEALMSDQLKDGMVLPTVLDNETLTVDAPRNVTRIETTTGQRVSIGTADLMGGKTVVHIIPQVLIPDSAPIEGPASGDECTHTVQAGETLYTISQQFGVSVDDLVKLNKLANPSSLQIGQTLVLYASCLPA